MTEVFCVTGAGGVGKTTMAASMALTLARSGMETLVITVDPARRLGQALGMEGLLTEAHPTAEPHLWASMLDAQGSWQDIARHHASPDAADRLAGNAFFQAIANRFPASQAYAAADRMTTEAQSGRWDAVVVDTPPSAGGVEFFTAPSALLDLINGPLLRALTGGNLPGSRTAFRLTIGPLLKITDSILGSEVLEDLTAFFFDLRTTASGLTARSAEIDEVFRRARNFIVTTADPTPLREARHFSDLLPSLTAPAEALIFNRAVPPQWAYAVAPEGDDPAAVNLRLWAAEALRQAALRRTLGDELGVPVVTIPWRPVPPTTLNGLGDLTPPGLLG